MEPIERAARAMCDADAKRRGNRYGGSEYMSDAQLERFRIMARAGIGAIHEPTDRMIGTAALLTIRINSTDEIALLGAANADLVWRYMSDRALDGQPYRPCDRIVDYA